jgi:hypothetical protein
MGFYKNHVRLTKGQVAKLADYREANKTRVDNGLKNGNKPLPDRHINQGSYAMRTINQDSDNDYDIDVGVVFKIDALKGFQVADKSALDTRNMVCDAVQDQRFKKAPEVRLNCVRVYYNEGHHVDMPIYREHQVENEGTVIELASSGWKVSDPEAVTRWFNQAVIEKSPDETNGRQMRRIVRLIKYWCKSRKSWNMPTGFIISKLVDECYQPIKDRDDEALCRTLTAMRHRLLIDKDVYHPVIQGERISEGKEGSITEMANRLEDALKDLSVLENHQCTKQTALKAWTKFFSHLYFEESLKSANAGIVTPTIIASKTPKKPVERHGEARFG